MDSTASVYEHCWHPTSCTLEPCANIFTNVHYFQAAAAALLIISSFIYSPIPCSLHPSTDTALLASLYFFNLYNVFLLLSIFRYTSSVSLFLIPVIIVLCVSACFITSVPSTCLCLASAVSRIARTRTFTALHSITFM